MFPSLTLKEDGVLHSEGIGVPQNGVNSIPHSIPNVDDSTWIDIDVEALGPSIVAASLVSVTNTNINIDFTQTGTDQAKVYAKLVHSATR